MPPTPAADRNLLFGILALQMDFISRDALVAAMNAWVLDKAKPLGQILQERGELSSERRTLLEALVDEHLKQHGNNAQQSLAAVSSIRSVRQELQQIADADVQASLVQVAAEQPDPNSTSPEVVGNSTGALARFRVLRPHARGGLGEVFVARDEELHRDVALKEIQQRHAAHPENRARFVLEAEVTGQLEHPGIVPVYGLGNYADGRPFYAMRFVKGDSLKDAIAAFHQAEQAGQSESARSLGLRGLLGRFVDVCQAIAYAHSRGVLHRDLKPGNIMLGKYGETLVVDWGLAKVLGQAEPETSEAAVSGTSDSALTQTGKALGTPAYMSPEQAAGRLKALGPASDVYSLGATLYCLLTGRAPFADNDIGALLGKVQKGALPPPRQVQPRVPAALEAVCLKAMALKPEDRYESPKELSEEIEHWLADEPVRAYREPLRRRLGRWARRHPAAVAGTLALVFTALVGLGIGFVVVSEEQQARREQQRKARQAQVDALLDVAPQAVPALLAGLEPYRDEIRPLLRAVAEKPEPVDVTPEAKRLWRQHRARAAQALLAEDAGQVELLTERLLEKGLDPSEMLLVREGLLPHAADLKEQLWQRALQTADGDFRALVALAVFDPDSRHWQQQADIAVKLLLADSFLLATWMKGLRPVRAALLAPLTGVYRDDKASAERRTFAATVLGDYAADNFALLSDLLLDATPQQYAVLFPLVAQQREATVARMQQELERARQPDLWKDGPLDPAWTQPTEELRREVETAQGLVAERWAMCQALPLDRVTAVTEGLRSAGYRPVRVRPWVDPASRAGSERAAVVWSRDGRDWKLETALSPPAVVARAAHWQTAGYLPQDVAGLRTAQQGNRYTLLCRQAAPGEQARLYVEMAADGFKPDGFIPATVQGLADATGEVQFCGVWIKAVSQATNWNLTWITSEDMHGGEVDSGASLLVDLSVAPPPPPALNNLRHPVQAVGVLLMQQHTLAMVLGSRFLPQEAQPSRYAAVWHNDTTREAVGPFGLSAAAHLARCRELAGQGYRPAALSVALREDGTPVVASSWQRPVPKREEREQLARRAATGAVTVLKLAPSEDAWQVYRHRADPEARSQLVWRGGLLGLNPRLLVKRLDEEKDVSALRALIVALGEFTGDQLPLEMRRPLVEKLLTLYRTHPDPGVHGAIDWLLRHSMEGPEKRFLDWGQAKELQRIDAELRTRDTTGASPVALAPGVLRDGRRWYVNGQGQTLVLIPGPVEFRMGSPPSDPERQEGERPATRRIPRHFAIGSRHVTVAEFQRFLKERPDVQHSYTKRYSLVQDGPIISVTWYEAAQYCNWLSEKEGLPEKEWCYPRHADIKDGMKLERDYLQRKGYRLPTEAEWEYACRAGAETSRTYGSSLELLPRYAWYQHNAQDRTWPVGLKRPNDLGLFDMHGNVWNWLPDPIFYYPKAKGSRVVVDEADLYGTANMTISDSKSGRVVRGGSFNDRPSFTRARLRFYLRPAFRSIDVGLRFARTVVNDGPTPPTRQVP